MAGMHILQKRELIRPAQDCSDAYGKAVIFYKGNKQVGQLVPDGFKYSGLHTFNVKDKTFIIDLKKEIIHSYISLSKRLSIYYESSILHTVDGWRWSARLLALIANELAQRNHDIVVATNTEFNISYDLVSQIKIVSLYRSDSYTGIRFTRMINLIKDARRIAKQETPDVIVTMLPPVSFSVKLATMGLRIPTIFADVTSYTRNDSRFVHFVRYHFYRLADAVTIQTENDRKF